MPGRSRSSTSISTSCVRLSMDAVNRGAKATVFLRRQAGQQRSRSRRQYRCAERHAGVDLHGRPARDHQCTKCGRRPAFSAPSSRPARFTIACSNKPRRFAAMRRSSAEQYFSIYEPVLFNGEVIGILYVGTPHVAAAENAAQFESHSTDEIDQMRERWRAQESRAGEGRSPNAKPRSNARRRATRSGASRRRNATASVICKRNAPATPRRRPVLSARWRRVSPNCLRAI